MGARSSVQTTRVRGAENDVLWHECDELITASGATRVTLRNAPSNNDLARERREDDLRAVVAIRPALGTGGWDLESTLTCGVAPIPRTLPAGAVSRVDVTATEADLCVEHGDDKVVIRRTALREELGLAGLCLADFSEHQPATHLTLIGVVTGVATLLLLAEHDSARSALLAQSPHVLATLWARHHWRVANRHHTALTAAPLLSNHDDRKVHSCTFKANDFDRCSRSDLAGRNREHLIDVLFCILHDHLLFVLIGFYREREISTLWLPMLPTSKIWRVQKTPRCDVLSALRILANEIMIHMLKEHAVSASWRHQLGHIPKDSKQNTRNELLLW